MTITREIWLFFTRKVVATVRQPVWILSGLATPLLYLLLFAPLLKEMTVPPTTSAVLHNFIPGVLTLLAFGSGMGAGWTVIWELQGGVIERFRVTPASRLAMLMGGVLKDVVAFLLPAQLVLLIVSFFGVRIHLAGMGAMLLLLSLLTAIVSAWSCSLGLTLRQIESLAAVVTGLQLPLTLLSGALLPMKMGPPWLQVLAHFNPLYYAVEASRRRMAGVLSSMEFRLAIAVLIPLAFVVFWWAVRVYKQAVA